MSCSACHEMNMPECTSTIYIDGLLSPGVTYRVVFENHFGAKQIVEKTASEYTAIITIDVSEDLPEGYFFRGNTYKVKAYASDEDLNCDSAASICAYKTCVALNVYEAAGAESEFTISCCE